MSGMQDLTIPLLAGEEKRFQIPGNYFQVVGSSDYVYLSFNSSPYIRRRMGMGGPVGYHEVLVKSLVDQTVVLSLGYADPAAPYDNSAILIGTLTVNETIPSVYAPIADVAVPNGGAATLLLAVDTTRREVLVRTLSTAAGIIRLGDSTVAAGKGFPLEPGDAAVIAGTAALYAANEAAVPVSVALLAMRKP